MTRPLDVDPRTDDRGEVAHVLNALVVPRAIAWVSTLSPTGAPNLAPHSYFTVASTRPAHIVFSSEAVRDTLTNIRATGEFVVNVVSMPQLERMNLTSTEVGPEHDEFALAGLTPAPSVVVRPPRVAEARAHLECRAVREVPVGEAHLVIAEVLHLHADAGVVSEGRIDPTLLDPVARLSGAMYASLGPLVRLPRPARPLDPEDQ